MQENKNIDMFILNEYGAYQEKENPGISKEDLIQYINDNFEDFSKIKIVRRFSKIFRGESANPLAYTHDCTTIEKEDINGNTSKLEFCPFDIQSRPLTNDEQQLINEPVAEDERIVYVGSWGGGRYAKLKEDEIKNMFI